ncbi:RDD family protein [Nostoc sp. UHCC 0702]|nr:RDD family protein [Nostoc sp. UHCC 0702]
MTATSTYVKYASFFKRFIASSIDGIILIIFNAIALGREPNEVATFQAGMYYILGIIINWLYFALLESSSIQGTFGKKILGIAVTDTHGNKISFGRATARYFGKVIWLVIFLAALLLGGIGQSTGGESSPYWVVAGLLMIIAFLILTIGYLMALFTAEKQALHDIIARCWVINERKQSATIPWKSLIIASVVVIIIGRGIVPQMAQNFISDIPSANTTSTPEASESPSPSLSEPPSLAPIPTPNTQAVNTNLPPQVLSRLQDMTLNNIEITEVETPRTYNICNAPLQLLQPNSYDTVDDDLRLDWTTSGIAYVARLKIQGFSGRMRTIFPNGKGGLTTIDQTMQLYNSAKGYVLLGFNPIDVDTQQPSKEYQADNLIIRVELDGSRTVINCDNGGGISSAIAQKF